MSRSRRLLVDVSPLRESPVFRRLFIGRSIMLFGVGMVGVTVPIHVFALTGSSAAVAAASSAEGLAFFTGFMVGGVLADRFDRWHIIRVARLGSGASFAGLTVNALLGGTAVWPIVVLVAVNGLAGASGITALLAVLPSLVDRAKLHAVGALNTLSLRLGTVLAPVAGGAVIAIAGPAWSYGLGAVLALVTTPLLRRPAGTGADPHHVASGVGPMRALWLGYRHVRGDRVVLGVMVAGVVGMFGGGSLVLIPALVHARVGNSPTSVGLMYSALSAGMVVGAAASGWIRQVRRPGLLLLAMMVACFLCYAAAGAAPLIPLAAAGIAAAGAVNSVEEVLRYTLLQVRTPDDLLGRVNSLFAAQNMSGVAVGALAAGAVGTWLDPVTAFWSYNLIMAAAAVLVLLLLPTLRRHRTADIPTN